MKETGLRTGKVFWGMVFVTAGVVFFLERFGIMPVGWHDIWRFWPIILIVWGVALLMAGLKGRWIAAGFAGLFLGVVLAGFLSMLWFQGEPFAEGQVGQQDFKVAWSHPVEKARFVLDTGAGTFLLSDTTAELLEATTRTGLGEYRLVHDSTDGEESLRLTLEGRRGGWNLGRISNKAEIRLNRNPLWQVEIDGGAARVEFDLSAFKVEQLRLNTGAASVRLTLGDQVEESHVEIDAGASSVYVRIPESVGAEITVDAALASKRFESFRKVRGGLYRTENFDTASKKIYMTMDAGLSSLKVVRY
jgi:hypothetical protein